MSAALVTTPQRDISSSARGRGGCGQERAAPSALVTQDFLLPGVRVGRGYLRALPLLPTLWCEAQACSVAGAYPSYLSNSAYNTRRLLAAGAESRKAIFAGEGGSRPWAARHPLGCTPCEYPGSPAQPGRSPGPCPCPMSLSHAAVPRPAAPANFAAAVGAGGLLCRLWRNSGVLSCCSRSRGGINFGDPVSVWCLWEVQRGGVKGWKQE